VLRPSLRHAIPLIEILALQTASRLHPLQITEASDIDKDGRIGLAEAVYALQVAAEMRLLD